MEEEDAIECPVCDQIVSRGSYKQHLKQCKKQASSRWHSNFQIPPGMNLNCFIQDISIDSHKYVKDHKKQSDALHLEYPKADFECPICLKDITTMTGYVRRTKCNHIFCQNCIDRWNVINPHCPKCREKI